MENLPQEDTNVFTQEEGPAQFLQYQAQRSTKDPLKGIVSEPCDEMRDGEVLVGSDKWKALINYAKRNPNHVTRWYPNGKLLVVRGLRRVLFDPHSLTQEESDAVRGWLEIQ